MIYCGLSRNNIFVLLTRSCKLLMLCEDAGGEMRGLNGGRLWCMVDWQSSRYKYHCGLELVLRVLVDDVSSYPEGCGRTLVLIFRQIFKENFRKISELHGKKYPRQKFEHMSCTISQFPQIVGTTKEQIRAIIWKILSKNGNKHF